MDYLMVTETTVPPTGWEKIKLGDLFSFKNGINAEKISYGQGTKFINVMEIIKNNVLTYDSIFGKITLGSKKIDENLVVYGDILFNRTSETPEEIGLTSVYLDTEKVVFGGFVIRARSKTKKINDRFKKYCFASPPLRREIIRSGQGVVRMNIGQGDLSKISIFLPPLPEQEKIVEVLETWEIYLKAIMSIIKYKRLLRKGLRQKLLNGSVRLPGFHNQWEKRELGTMIREISSKTTSSNQYEIFSVTKNGIVPQSKYFDKQIASENNTGYKIIKKDNLVFSTMNLWMGSLDFFKEKIGIVSPAYKIFDINKEEAKVDFLKIFLKTPHMLNIYKNNSEQGASIVRRNLDLKSLLTTFVQVPDYEEQTAIAQILTTADQEIEALEKKKTLIEAQKKFLLNNLVTGKIRLPEFINAT